MAAPFAYSVDGFQRGKFALVQPKKGAHRSGLDALLLASLLPAGFSGHMLDMGAGAGAIGFAIAARTKAASVTLLEHDAQMAECARMGLALNENASLTARMALVEADITSGSAVLASHGLLPNHFDAILTNPPYNLSDMQPSNHAIRAKAHKADGDVFEIWLRVTAGLLKPKGILGLIARPQALPHILAAMDRRFGAIEITLIHAHEGENAIRMVISAVKNARGPLKMRPALVLHDKETRAYRPDMDRLINGAMCLDDL